MLNLRVRELAEAQGLNIQQLADRAGISYDTALKYWYNQVQRYDRRTLDAIARALRVKSLDLLYENGA